MRTTGTTRRASPAEYGRILSDLAGHIRINRLYENELVGYLCATFLLWLRDQSPQTAHIRLIVSKLLMHVISIISARKSVPYAVPHLGLYTALLRRSVDLLCSPLPDVDWAAHIISKMGFATVFIRDYSPALDHLLQLAFPEHQAAGHLVASQALHRGSVRSPELPTPVSEAFNDPSWYGVEEPLAATVRSVDPRGEQLGLNAGDPVGQVERECELPIPAGTVGVAVPDCVANSNSLASRDKRGTGPTCAESPYSIEIVLHKFAGQQDDEHILALDLEPERRHNGKISDV